ncbi:glycosyltransferase [Algibacter mikhailovii]|uniref:glycosyltransferase n=1 Tax=Algibacter mikhailovii TaxID=425498 RepID=UPI002495274B|nr:glycosyltransferase [Algibacter mikhailovii]
MRKKGKWLFIVPTDKIGGAEYIIKSFSSFIIENGGSCRVIVLTRKKWLGWDELENRIQISYMPFSKYFLGVFSLIFFLFFKNYSDIEYSFSSQTIINGTLGFAKRIGLLKGKLVLRESNSIFHLLKGNKLKIYSFFYKMGYIESSLIVTQTGFMKSQLIDSNPILFNKLNIKTIPNPFDFKDIEVRSGCICAKFNNIRFFVAAGRLIPAKGFDILIDAFCKMTEHIEDIHLIILGEGRERRKLTEMAKELNMANRIHFPGYVDNVYSYFNKAEVCVISSRIEGFPNVLLQMMSQNSKVVATRSAGGIDDIPGVYTCSPESIIELKNSMLKAVKTKSIFNRDIFNSYLSLRSMGDFYNKLMEGIEKPS